MLEDKERDEELDHETGLGELSASDDEVRNLRQLVIAMKNSCIR